MGHTKVVRGLVMHVSSQSILLTAQPLMFCSLSYHDFACEHNLLCMDIGS